MNALYSFRIATQIFFDLAKIRLPNELFFTRYEVLLQHQKSSNIAQSEQNSWNLDGYL